MYSTCLFCHASLGANEAIEHFPVGKRLAFDAAKGRLWVVCRKCERWNLSPIEERWEAIEESERAYRDTKKRAATDHIGLARLRDGTDLIRIGEPLRPEFASWRYGDQFGRRRRKQILLGSAVAVAGVGVAGGLVAGSYAIGQISLAFSALGLTSNLFTIWSVKGKRMVIADQKGAMLRASSNGIASTVLRFNVPESESTNGIAILVPGSSVVGVGNGEAATSRGGKKFHATFSAQVADTPQINGSAALVAAARVLAIHNGISGSAKNIAEAVEIAGNAGSPAELVKSLPREVLRKANERITPYMPNVVMLHGLPAPIRLALEMTLHEDDERRALEGELKELELRWKTAEEIAAISDGLLTAVPPAVTKPESR